MELIGKLESDNTSKIGMLPSASKYVSIKFADQCKHILNNRYRLNGIKCSTQIQKRESIFKYQPRICNVKRNFRLIKEVRKCDGTTNYFHH